jgi:hypothetical protein
VIGRGEEKVAGGWGMIKGRLREGEVGRGEFDGMEWKPIKCHHKVSAARRKEGNINWLRIFFQYTFFQRI